MLQEAELSTTLDSENTWRLLEDYVLHRTRCTQEDDQLLVKDWAGRVFQEGKIGSTRRELDEADHT